VVRVFVHPFFYQYTEKYKPEVKQPDYNLHKLEEIKKGLLKILEKPEETTPPVFILEEAEHLDETKQAINEEGGSHNPAYFVPTHAKSAVPDVKGGNGKLYDFESWEEFRKIFLDLGVRKVIIGGMYLKVVHGYDLDPDMFEYRTQRRSKGAYNMEYDIEKCVRAAVSGLSQDEHFEHVFDVEISNLTFPNSRSDIRKKEQAPTYEDLYHKPKSK
jgi:hypothetical protein